MLYLLLSMLSSTLISVLMRLSERNRRSNLGMLAANYLMCSLMGSLYAGSMQLFPASADLPRALGLGAVNGVFYLGSFMLLQWNISKNGVVLPATFMKLGVLVPTLASVVIFGETPRAVQIVGFIMALAAILLMQGGSREKTHSFAGLILLLIGGGMGDVMSKVFEEVGPAALRNQFLLYTFGTALILCILLCILRRQKPSFTDVLWGLAVGVPNYFSSRFLLLSLSEIPAIVAYPSYSAGTIILAALFGTLFFRERLNARKLISLGVILAALVLLNL